MGDDLIVVANELIPIYKTKQGECIVNARELHGFLKVGKDFSSWIKDRIYKYGFTEGADYTSFTKIGEREIGATRLIEYLLTIDTAKEIAMVENNEQGRIIRRYFIEIEKQHKAAIRDQRQMTQAEILAALAQETVKLEREVKTVKAEVTEMKEVLSEEPAENWQETMSNEVRRICYKYGLDYHEEYCNLYAALESRAFCDLSSRVTRKKKRMKLSGAKVKQIEAVTKLQVIAEDPKLKAIFESVLQRWKLRQMNREAAL
jgi:anti-repressor protein